MASEIHSAAGDVVPLGELGERLASVRLLPARDLEMAASLRRFGQLSPVVVFRTGDRLEVIDGFRRLRAASGQGYPEQLAVRRLELDGHVAALAALFALHRGSSRLCDLEEGWVVRTLVREHRLAQVQVAQMLRRHQSWVSRRLLLVEALAAEVQEDIRLGLFSATAAREVARLPRGIQWTVARAITRHGLSTRQAAGLCAAVERQGVQRSDEVDRLAAAAPAPRPSLPKAKTAQERLTAELGLLEQVALRLRGRLLRALPRAQDAALRRQLEAARLALVALLDTLTGRLEGA